jgi:hypothetical protein
VEQTADGHTAHGDTRDFNFASQLRLALIAERLAIPRGAEVKKQPTAREINAHLSSMRSYCDVYNQDGTVAVRISRSRTVDGVLQGRSLWTGEWTAIEPSQYVALPEPNSRAASTTVDNYDVKEFVASISSGFSPYPDVAQGWLNTHAEGIEEAMEEAWKSYVAEHWKGDVR